MSNQVAPSGMVFICSACGKRSRDRYGEKKVDQGWDESCMLHAVLCYDTPRNGKWIAVEGVNLNDNP